MEILLLSGVLVGYVCSYGWSLTTFFFYQRVDFDGPSSDAIVAMCIAPAVADTVYYMFTSFLCR